VFQIGFSTSTNFPGIFSTTSHFFLSYFHSELFLLQELSTTGSHLSASLSPHWARSSARHLHLVHGLRQRCHARAPHHKAVADRAPVPLLTASIRPPIPRPDSRSEAAAAFPLLTACVRARHAPVAAWLRFAASARVTTPRHHFLSTLAAMLTSRPSPRAPVADYLTPLCFRAGLHRQPSSVVYLPHRHASARSW
jgi:hypothetical protein